MRFYIKRIGERFGVYRRRKLCIVVDYMLRDEIVHSLIANGYVDKRESWTVKIIDWGL